MFIRLYARETALQFSHDLDIAPTTCGRRYAGADGRFFFETVPPGTYVVRAWSHVLGTTTTEATVEANQLTDNVVIVFADGGTLEIVSVDAATGSALTPKHGSAYLLDENGQLTNLSLGTTGGSTAVVHDVLPGAYLVGLYLWDVQERIFQAPMAAAVQIRQGQTSSVTLRARQAVFVLILVVDADRRPISHFYARAYGPDGSLYAASGSGANVDNDVGLTLSPGTVRLVLTREGETIYDDYLDIAPEPEARAFETTVTIDGWR